MAKVRPEKVRRNIMIKKEDILVIEEAAALKTDGNVSRYMSEASTERARKDLAKGK